MKEQYYTLKNIDMKKARYNMIFGQRSNGKTFAVLQRGIENYFRTGKQMAIIRRWQEDFKGKRGKTMFDNLVNAKIVEKESRGVYNTVIYYTGMWYFAHVNGKGETDITCKEPFAFSFALNDNEHDKSTSYPNVTTVLFDEFISRDTYIYDEFVAYMNTLSTIIRKRDDVIIYMCGNTINKYCPYFKEMGITHILKMKKGDIDIYEYGESGLRVAVEYADSPNKHEKSDVYFAFDNPKLRMITTGEWELSIYPHKPTDFRTTDIIYIYFIVWEQNVYQCEIVQIENNLFTFIHRKTSKIKNTDTDLVFSTEYHSETNYVRKITRPTTKTQSKIFSFFVNGKVFYQDNEVGNDIYNYLLWCGYNFKV